MPSAPDPGQTLDEYTIVRKLGEGASSDVLLACEEAGNRVVLLVAGISLRFLAASALFVGIAYLVVHH